MSDLPDMLRGCGPCICCGSSMVNCYELDHGVCCHACEHPATPELLAFQERTEREARAEITTRLPLSDLTAPVVMIVAAAHAIVGGLVIVSAATSLVPLFSLMGLWAVLLAASVLACGITVLKLGTARLQQRLEFRRWYRDGVL